MAETPKSRAPGYQKKKARRKENIEKVKYLRNKEFSKV